MVAIIVYLHFVADSLESVVANSGVAGNLCRAGLAPRRAKRLVTRMSGYATYQALTDLRLLQSSNVTPR